jgi:hypothetical protein
MGCFCLCAILIHSRGLLSLSDSWFPPPSFRPAAAYDECRFDSRRARTASLGAGAVPVVCCIAGAPAMLSVPVGACSAEVPVIPELVPLGMCKEEGPELLAAP